MRAETTTRAGRTNASSMARLLALALGATATSALTQDEAQCIAKFDGGQTFVCRRPTARASIAARRGDARPGAAAVAPGA